ncbi:MAG: hypothetical protein LBF88_13875 [Planctomycetaceae bacterium]|nr:hypothetical protein [Planctomycetaceae bacterium]
MFRLKRSVASCQNSKRQEMIDFHPPQEQAGYCRRDVSAKHRLPLDF